LSSCTYKQNYFDLANNESKIFECDNNSLPSKSFCEFHDDDYHLAHGKELKKSFLNKLSAAQHEKSSLLCVGYNLPQINLVNSKYDIDVNFSFAKFHEDFDISKSVFNKTISFRNAHFLGNISAIRTTFKNQTNFSNCTFAGNSTSFQLSTFVQANFDNSIIETGYFTESKLGDASFENCNFKNDVTFSKTIFKNANFKKCHFSSKSDFSNSVFENNGIFEKIQHNSVTNFFHVTFLNPKSIIFEGNLSNISFLETDLKEVKFGDYVTWESIPKISDVSLVNKIKRSFLKLRTKNTKFKIYDELLIEEENSSCVSLESVQNVYRNLRENFDYQLRYEISGEFFVREMELKRKYREMKEQNVVFAKRKNFLSQHLTFWWFYLVISQYGQSYYRPIIVSVPILVFSFFWFSTTGFHNVDIFHWNLVNTWKTAFIRSLSAFFPFYTFGQFENLSDFVLRLILLPISGSFFISLKRKLERRFRH